MTDHTPDTRSLDLAEVTWPLKLAMRRLKLGPLTLCILGFTLYWGVPFLAAAISGALVSAAFVASQLAPLGLDVLVPRAPSSSTLTVGYAADTVHLAMALVVPTVGGWVSVTAIGKFAGLLRLLLDSGQLLAPQETVDAELAKGNRWLRTPIAALLLGVVATLLAAFMATRCFDDAYVGWWGHRSHGWAGACFVVAVWGMVYFGGMTLYALAVGLHVLSRLFLGPVRLRPFSTDGCNGFGRVGDYFLLLFALSLVVGGAVWITFGLGYLGVERFVVTWIGGAFGLATIPLILILPLTRLTRRISEARDERFLPIEGVLHRKLEQLERVIGSVNIEREFVDEVESLVKVRDALFSVYPSNTFPFRPRIAGILTASYLIQVVLFLKEGSEAFNYLR